MIPDCWNVAQVNPQLRRWEHIYNTVRPHQSAPLSHPARIPGALEISTKESRVSLIMWTSTESHDGKRFGRTMLAVFEERNLASS